MQNFPYVFLVVLCYLMLDSIIAALPSPIESRSFRCLPFLFNASSERKNIGHIRMCIS